MSKGKRQAILYAAKSTEDKRGSIPTQLEDGRAFAEREGLEVVAEYKDEKASAYKGNRGPELAKAIAHAARIGAILIVQHSDRLARGDGKKARHLAELFFSANREGITLRSVQDDSTFDSPILAAVMGERNMEDSRRKAMAIKAGHERRRKRGLYHGGLTPFGYINQRNEDDERRLVIYPVQAEVVRRIFDEYLAGRSMLAIALALQTDGLRTRQGRPWRSVGVRKILMNSIYAGFIRDGEELIEGQHEAIVTRETWEKAEALRIAKTRTHKRGRTPLGKHLFRKGFLRCGICGSAMVPRTMRRPSGGLYEAYYCAKRQRALGSCERLQVRREKVDDAVYAYFKNLDLDIDATRAQMASATERKLAEARELLEQAQREEQESEARLKRVKRDYINGDLTAAEWRELRAELELDFAGAKAETKRLRGRLQEAEEGIALAEAQEDVLRTLSEVRGAIAKEITDAEGAAAVRAVLMRLFEGFVLHSEGLGQERIGLANGKSWIEPLVIEHVIQGYSDGLKPAFSRSPLAARNNCAPAGCGASARKRSHA